MTRPTRPRPPSPEPSREQLELAFRQMRRPGWPRDLDAALANHNYAICVRALALDLRRLQPCAPNRPRVAASAPVPPTPSAPPTPPTPPTTRIQRTPRTAATARRAVNAPRCFDVKRAAANDFD